MRSNPLVLAHNLDKSYGKLAALSNVSLVVSPGEILGIRGDNGAGKSTLLSVLATLIRPSGGTLRINGWDVLKDPSAARPLIGYVPQEIALYGALSALDNLLFWGGLYGLKGEALSRRCQQVLDLVGLEHRAKHRAETLSGGMQRRLNVAAALIHQPLVLIMDEPTVGMDMESRRVILKCLEGLSQQKSAVIMTSHQQDELEKASHRLITLKSGKLTGEEVFREK